MARIGSADELRILVATSLGHFLCHYNVTVFPALVLPLAARLNLETGQVVGLSFLQYLLFGVSALPWGLLGDRLGGNRLLMLMFLGSGLAAIPAVLCIDSPNRLYWSLGALGLFSGIYHPIGMGMISKGVQRINMALGYNAVFGGLGLVLAPLLTGIANWLWGAEAAFLLVVGLNFLGAGLLLLLLRSHHTTAVAVEREARAKVPVDFAIFLLAMVFAGMVITGVTVILPAYLELHIGKLFQAIEGLYGSRPSSNLFATTVMALVYSVGMLGQFTGGIVGERRDPGASYLWFHCVCLFMAFLMAFASNLPLVFLANAYSFFLLGAQAMENTVLANLVPRHMHHSAFGVKYIIYFGAGAIAVKLVGWIDSRWGSEAVFLGIALASALLVITFGMLLCRIRRTSEARYS